MIVGVSDVGDAYFFAGAVRVALVLAVTVNFSCVFLELFSDCGE